MGAEIDFELIGSEEKIQVFSTRPDTIFGATFLALSPEHPSQQHHRSHQHCSHHRHLCPGCEGIERQCGDCGGRTRPVGEPQEPEAEEEKSAYHSDVESADYERVRQPGAAKRSAHFLGNSPLLSQEYAQ